MINATPTKRERYEEMQGSAKRWNGSSPVVANDHLPIMYDEASRQLHFDESEHNLVEPELIPDDEMMSMDEGEPQWQHQGAGESLGYYYQDGAPKMIQQISTASSVTSSAPPTPLDNTFTSIQTSFPDHQFISQPFVRTDSSSCFMPNYPSASNPASFTNQSPPRTSPLSVYESFAKSTGMREGNIEIVVGNSGRMEGGHRTLYIPSNLPEKYGWNSGTGQGHMS